MLEKLILVAKLLLGSPELECMAEAIYFEGRNQSYKGQLAIGEVITTRSYHQEQTPCYTVHTDCQFEYYCDGKKETIYDEESYKFARIAAAHSLLIGPGIVWYYHNTSVDPEWPFTKLYTIDEHVFYSR